MQIKKIHTYLVNPGKASDEALEVSGTTLELRTGKLFLLLKGIFDNAPFECEHDIIFRPNERGQQSNLCKDLLVAYAKSRTLENGKQIALHLQNVTTRRSGQGLLFLIFGETSTNKRLVISRFPADNGIVAEEGRTLSVEFVEKIFMKNSKAYKSAVYEGASLEADFWEGKAVDKQINSDIDISEYWIKKFLLSDFSATAVRATMRLAEAVKVAIRNADTLEIKDEIASAIKLARSMDKRVTNSKKFLEALNLSKNTQNLILENIEERLHGESFRFSADELYKHISFKSVELDTGAYLSAPTEVFGKVFEIRSSGKDGAVSISTQGKIVNEQLKKSK